MVDAKSELQAVEKLQQLSLQQDKLETSRMRSEFAELQQTKSSLVRSPSTDISKTKSIIKEVHFSNDNSKPPAIAPKPKPRDSLSPAPREKVKGVTFSDNLPTRGRTPSPMTPIKVKPPPGYENEGEKEEKRLPAAPPPYDVAVGKKPNHSRQAEITALIPDLSNDLGLSDSREQLVDGSDQESESQYYENGGFDEYEESEFESGYTNYLNTTPVSTSQRVSESGNAPPIVKGPLHMAPSIKDYSKSRSSPIRLGQNGDLAHMDYVNVYEDSPQDERYVGDIHNRYVEDLYPERVTPVYQPRNNISTNHQRPTESPNPWSYPTNNLFFMTDGLKSSEC